PESITLRGGHRKKMDSRELVPGDIVILKMGNIVPADVKILKDEQVKIDESALTGESVPVDKKGNEVAYSGTTIKRGEAKAVVIATGNRTKFARTVELVQSAEEKSHFQKAVMKIGYYIIAITGVLIAGIIVAGILRHEKIIEVLLFALVVTIAGIPAALPAVLSVTMSIGANRLAQKKAIVSRLSAMEEMAGLEILCSDKTGTLTKNELELQEPVILNAENKEEVIIAAALTTEEDNSDPIDKAILEGLEDKEKLKDYKTHDFRPFDPTRKRAEADVEINGNKFTVAKGAPQVIADLIDNKGQAEEINNKIDEQAKKGFRTLGVAKKENGNWKYLGLLPLLDPPREDSAEVINDAKNHGIGIKMVTGDHTSIAKTVAKQLDLEDNILHVNDIFGSDSENESEESNSETIDDDEFLSASGFAEVTPEHKFKIIKKYQKNDRIVGMTGDGVNDAPALKQADVGIAVSSATDAARSAAALVLTKPGLGVIINAIEEARRIFERMTGYATYRITESLRVVLFMTISIIALRFYPVTAIMVVLLAILNDIPIMTIAFDNVPTADHPVRWDMKRVLGMSTILSIGGVISSFLFFWFIYEYSGWDQHVIRTMIFLKLLVAGHMTIYLTRNTGWFWQKPYPNWILFVSLESTQVIGTLFAVYGWLIHPIGWGKAGIAWGYALVWMLLLNALKVLAVKIFGGQFSSSRKKSRKSFKQENNG
ncbi:MAG TPA: plasma-membrane proton-efflux P-type ATPase, partial [Bacteroidales bacterium]|nr:plasma-membrane proton-efflux P-type ATPase [Bacteroidales bacterium]